MLFVVVDDLIDEPLILVGPGYESCDVLCCDDQFVYTSYQQQDCRAGDKEVAETSRQVGGMDASGQHNDDEATADYDVYFFAS